MKSCYFCYFLVKIPTTSTAISKPCNVTEKKILETLPASYGLVDNLTMTYNGNQLTKVTDAVATFPYAGSADFKDNSNVATEYLYNRNGAMNKDLNKGISEILRRRGHFVRALLKGQSFFASQHTDYKSARAGETLAYTYNGNISRMQWTQASKQRAYDFAYDNLSRLKTAAYTGDGDFTAGYTYDKHGNIKTLQRYGKKDTGNAAGFLRLGGQPDDDLYGEPAEDCY